LFSRFFKKICFVFEEKKALSFFYWVAAIIQRKVVHNPTGEKEKQIKYKKII